MVSPATPPGVADEQRTFGFLLAEVVGNLELIIKARTPSVTNFSSVTLFLKSQSSGRFGAIFPIFS